MGFTQQEVDSFHRFAAEKLSNGGSASSLEECLRMWRAERDEAETIASVRRGEEDIAAGRYSTLDEVGAEVRERFGNATQKQSS